MIPVLYLIDHLRQGGSERYVAELARQGQEIGTVPHVGCFSDGGLFSDELRRAGIPPVHFPLRTLYHPSTGPLLLRMRRYVLEHKIRIVHSFQPNANILGTLLGRMTGVPVIISRRSLGDFGSLGSRRLGWLQKNVTNRMADRVLVNSMAVRKAVTEMENIPFEKVVLIYNGLDLERFAPRSGTSRLRPSLGIPSDAFVFGISSGLRPVKGVDVAIRGFSRIRERFPNARLVISGDGPERERLESLARQTGSESSVLFLGTRPDMEDIYPIFDVFVLASHSEGFSNAALEAMGTGLPIIASRIGGNIEMIDEGLNGFLVPPGDPVAVSDRMETFLTSPGLSRKMGKESRAWVERTNAPSKIRRSFAALYSEVLDG